jgi:chemotaxis protein histidine kinase CheA
MTACSSVGSNPTSGPVLVIVPPSDNSAASQKARADYAMQQARQQQADANAAAVLETAQARSNEGAAALASKSTAQALAVLRAQVALTADAANYPSTQAAMVAQQTAHAAEVQATVDARAMKMAQQQSQTTATAEALSAHQTAQAIEVQATFDARAVLLAQQQSQFTATSEAMLREVVTTQQAAITAHQAAITSQRLNNLMAWLIPVAAVIAFGLLLFLGWRFITGMIDDGNTRRSLENKRYALPASLFAPPSQTIIIADDPLTGVALLHPLNSVDDDDGFDAKGALIDEDAALVNSETQPVIVILPNSDNVLSSAEAREEAARYKLAMRLLRDAIQHVGKLSNRIPPAEQMGWPERAWTNAVAILRPYGAEILQGVGGGTYLVGMYSTLQALYIAIGERRLNLYPH